MNGDFVNWDVFGSYAGAVTMTAIITEFLKKVPYINKCNAQLLAFIVAVLLLVAAAVFNGGWQLESIIMAVINAVVVALASNGTYDVINSGKPAIKEAVKDNGDV